MSLETEVASLTAATSALIRAVNASKAALDQKVADAGDTVAARDAAEVSRLAAEVAARLAVVAQNASEAIELDLKTNWSDKLATASFEAGQATASASAAKADRVAAAASAALAAAKAALAEAAQIAAKGSEDEALSSAVESERQANISTTSAIKSTAREAVSTNSAAVSGTKSDIARVQAVRAAAARVGAEVARDAAQLSSGVYPNTTEGLLATPETRYFSVPSANNNEYLILYRHELAGGVSVAVEIERYPSVSGIEYTVANVLHIKSNGNDARDGLSWKNALRSIDRALALAWLNPEPTLIEWAPEKVVYTKGHLDMPDNCVIKAAHRTVFLRPEPGYEERNVFRMGSGCFIEGIMFEGFRLDSLTNPSEGFAVSFRPDAIIMRVPYAHKIAVRSIPTWGVIAPPLDRVRGNPEVPRGGGVALADGLVCSQYSIFPNIMTWGGTPVTPNGIGYVAKNGGLVNAVNAVCIWAHRHFLALSGGQLILSSCSTQFGDYSLHAKGYREVVAPKEVEGLTIQTQAEAAILAAEQELIDNMWGALVFYDYAVDDKGVDWNAELQRQTRRDAATFLQCMRWTLKTGNQQPMLDFAKGLFNVVGERVLTLDKLPAFIFSFTWLRDEIKKLAGVNAAADAHVVALVAALIDTVSNPIPKMRKEPSKITSIGHTWTAVMAGVALTKIPPARNGAPIQDSIIEEDEGVVIASGQDDQGNAIFVGGLEINAETGELGGPPFIQAVRRLATRAAISRSY